MLPAPFGCWVDVEQPILFFVKNTRLAWKSVGRKRVRLDARLLSNITNAKERHFIVICVTQYQGWVFKISHFIWFALIKRVLAKSNLSDALESIV